MVLHLKLNEEIWLWEKEGQIFLIFYDTNFQKKILKISAIKYQKYFVLPSLRAKLLYPVSNEIPCMSCLGSSNPLRILCQKVNIGMICIKINLKDFFSNRSGHCACPIFESSISVAAHGEWKFFSCQMSKYERRNPQKTAANFRNH